MSFNSFSFILIFLPIVLILWHGLNRQKKWKLADIIMILASLILYGLFEVKFVFILLLSCVINYGISQIIYKSDKDSKLFYASGVLFNILLLGFFKYTNFFISNIALLLQKEITELNVLLPVGISFYVFSQIAFLTDIKREKEGKIEEKEKLGNVGVLEYLFYITYFPKIIQGPIALPYEIITQIRNKNKRSLEIEKFRKGMELFVIGLSKKVILGDNLAKIADYGFKYTYYMDFLTGSLVLISYAFQLYFDFSGYCDMAEGVSLMLGIELPQNFNSPYKAISVRNLWQRWHMTLTRFFVRYVYIPLGGSRKGKFKTALNVIIIFLLSGFWHGAGWTYICWGLIMGLLVVWDDLGIIASGGDIKKHYLLRDKPLIVIPKKLGQMLTFIMFLISLIFFRSQNMTYALQFFKQLAIPTWPGFMYKTSAMLDISENYLVITAANMFAKQYTNLLYLFTWIVILIISVIVLSRKNAHELLEGKNNRKGHIIFLVLIFTWSFISLSQVSTFIYFQF